MKRTGRSVLAAGAACALAILAGNAAAGEGDAVDRILNEARAACEGFESGTFAANGAVREIALDDDDLPDRIVDESRFACSSAQTMYCGTGGCMLHAVIGDRVWSFQAEGWRMIEWGDRPILLVARDGAWCGGAGSQLCFEAVVWSFGEMLTVMPRAGQ